MSPTAADLRILEDDADRTRRMLEVADGLGYSSVVWPGAFDMLRDLERVLPFACLVSLDNDPDPSLPRGAPEPGEGIDVARWLASRPPTCPVIVHTSNSVRGDAMVGELELAGWTVVRVSPIGDDRIELDWRQVVRRLLRAKHRPDNGSGPAV